MFKKLLIIFGVIFVITILGITFFIGKGDPTMQKEGDEFVKTALPQILQTLDEDTFLKYSSPDLLKNLDSSKIKEMLNLYKKMGTFDQFLGAKGKIKTSYSFKERKYYYGKYVALARFKETGRAEIELTIINRNGNWGLYHIKINSRAFNELVKKDVEVANKEKDNDSGIFKTEDKIK